MNSNIYDETSFIINNKTVSYRPLLDQDKTILKFVST